MLRLVFTTEEGQLWSLELQAGRNRLGRKPDNDIMLENPGISSYHCELTLEGNQAVVRDLRSTNGTFIDGQRVGEKPAPLCLGQTLQVGHLKMVLQEVLPPVLVPQPEYGGEERAMPLPDGVPVCLNHPEEAAVWVCSQCGDYYCNPCVHHLRRVGGRYVNLCPHCSHPCRLLETAKRFKKKPLLKRLGRWLSRTVRLRP